MAEISAFDISKETSSVWWKGKEHRVGMRVKECLVFLKGLPPGTVVAMESTGQYHVKLAKAAFRMGFVVYVLNPRDVAAYREWTGKRAKTDRLDCELIHEFVRQQMDKLTRYVPKEALLGVIHELLRVRSLMVECKVSIQQSLKASGRLVNHLLGDPCKELTEKVDLCEKLINQFLKGNAGYRRLLKVKGFGITASAAMVCAYMAGEFKSANSFVAFLGLDVFVCQSGKWTGKCKITKRGNPLFRKILYTSAMAANHSHAFSGYYANLIERNMEPLRAIVSLSRKLARTAWSMLRHETEFDPLRIHLPQHQFVNQGATT